MLLLIKEDANDTDWADSRNEKGQAKSIHFTHSEEFGDSVRRTLLIQLRYCCNNVKIRETVLVDSEIPLLLVAKLSYFFVSLP